MCLFHYKNYNLVKLLVDQGIEPNLQCLENTCTNTGNFDTIKFLVLEKGIKPNAQCLKNIVKLYYKTDGGIKILINNLE